MDIALRFRLGIGFDIEHNEEVCFRAASVDENGEEKEEVLLCFVGLIVKLPFITIMMGQFIDRRNLE